ncbi:Uncharacterized conserved protein (DUF2054) [Nesidiocoris tenuis]|uniref:SREBP regulating gene protein n=1 Tax=Nesidiocoris tenuis TaxID=355587 RepID=A0ABN7ATM7_9HEMI|nr:Uncharacterized conserved protein (DUF2054) [Nesidiocoris tenuis]
MPLALITRFVRRKAVLFTIFFCSLCYTIVSLMKDASFSSGDEIDSIKFRNFDSLIWHSDDDDATNASSKITTCRNSVQGMTHIVDDRGYLCSRFHLLPSGCCDKKDQGTVRYSCDTCKDNGCCSIFEYCVSCCMQPSKKELLQSMLRRVPDTFHVVFASITDHYELCMAKCRTSSLSVQHENSYRDPSAKHCYNDV